MCNTDLFQNNADYASARADAIGYIGFALKSSGKVDLHLFRRGYDEDLRAQVISSLIEDGYINDHKVCVHMAKARTGRRSESVGRFCDRLIRGGVPRDVALDYLSEYPDDRQSIEALLNHKYDQGAFVYVSDEELYSKKLKMTRFLRSRGYSFGLIDKALSRRFNRVE